MGKPLPNIQLDGAVAAATRQPTFAFLLLDGFSQLGFAGAVETLAAANAVVGHPFYGWSTVTPDNKPARSLASLTLTPDALIDNLPRQAVLVVIGGRHIPDDLRCRVISMLRREVAHGRRLVGISDAVMIMAEAGVLAGQPCAVHWRDAATFAERFPNLDMRISAFVRSRHSTISGCIAATDFFLDRIKSDLGRPLAQVVADQITHRSAREGDAPQTASQACRIGDRSTTILQIVQAMEANIATPLTVGDMATRARVSTRQLERQFLRVFGTTPLRFYLKLRLERARDLMAETDIPLDDIAELTGFAGVPIFSRQYRKVFGISPSDRRATEPSLPRHQDADASSHGRTHNTPLKGSANGPSSRSLSHTHFARAAG